MGAPLPDGWIRGQAPHRPGEAAHLFWSLALGPERSENGAGEGRIDTTLDQIVDELDRLVLGQADPTKEVFEHLAHDSPRRSRKLRNKSSPCGVSMLSGWNWTPSTGSERCLTPMITPSEVKAVTTRSSGRSASMTASE